MKFDDLEHCIHEDILQEIEDPAAITAEVSKLLIGINHENIFVLRRVARDIAAAIARELAFKDGDMVDVVRRLGAALEPLISWLKCHGVNPRSLRITTGKSQPYPANS
jgi:hypothetical protein